MDFRPRDLSGNLCFTFILSSFSIPWFIEGSRIALQRIRAWRQPTLLFWSLLPTEMFLLPGMLCHWSLRREGSSFACLGSGTVRGDLSGVDDGETCDDFFGGLWREADTGMIGSTGLSSTAEMKRLSQADGFSPFSLFFYPYEVCWSSVHSGECEFLKLHIPFFYQSLRFWFV